MTRKCSGEVLLSTPLFEKLTSEELTKLNPLVQRRRYAAGEVIYELGSAPNELFVLVEGEVVLVVPVREDEKTLSTRHPPSVFGEIAVLDGQPRMVLARAKTDVEVLSVDAVASLEVLRSNPHAREHLHDFMCQITRQLARNEGDAGVEILRAIASAVRRAST
jgi:CRP-like cAMP-binding protein